MRIYKAPLFQVLTIIILSISLKLFLLFIDVIPFNADEAIVGLMAKHILQGEHSIFFYGQSYMGSLDAYLIAGVIKLIGEGVYAIRVVQIFLYALFIMSTYFIGKSIYGSNTIGFIAGLLLALPVVNITLYTTVSLGGYGEALVISNGLFILGYYLINELDQINKIPEKWTYQRLRLFSSSFCFLVGLGIWVNGITLVFSIPITLLLIIFILRNKSRIPLKVINQITTIGLLAGLIGLSPWMYYAITIGIDQLFYELLGSAVNVEMGSWLSVLFDHLVNYFLLGGTVLFGFRPPWEVRWLGLPLIPFVIFVWIYMIVIWLRKIVIRGNENQLQNYMIIGIFIFQFIGFVFTPFGVDPSGRYFLPLSMPLAILVGEIIDHLSENKRLKLFIVGLLILFNMTGNIQCALNNPPGITTQFDQVTAIDHSYDETLVDFLRLNNAFYGFSNYWVSYPLAYKSNEEILYIPLLPYHQDLRYTSRDNRIDKYNEIVFGSENLSYITTNNEKLDIQIETSLMNNEISWKEKIIGDYHIYYDLSRVILPENIFDYDT